MEFRILGPLEVDEPNCQIELGARKQRALLGVLLLHANEPISSERLVDELWGEQPPARAHKLVQGYVSALRKLLGPARLVTRPPGYLVRVEAGELDAVEFDRLAGEARAGRQADALEQYRSTRSLLADELGLEPSPELQRLERLVLTHDAELELPRVEATPPAPAPPAPAPPAPAPPPEPERLRRTVTVVFGDLAGSTALGERLDPETLHGVLDRYSETCADVLERHGGTVEKFIGDAVVAVFGLPSLHEDDALRAVRAAVELRQA